LGLIAKTNMQNFTKESILDAIKNIDGSPSLLKGRESRDYDLVLEDGRRYPPILVLSEANRILGGSELLISDFANSAPRAFKILHDLGFKVVLKKQETVNTVRPELDYKSFVEACKFCNFQLNEELAIRFIASLITKPFVILTGLSGSGKTKLALAFSSWISKLYNQPISKFKVGDEVKSSKKTYIVTAADRNSVTFTQRDTGTKATFPYELIDDWIKVIKENGFNEQTRPRDIRDLVEQRTDYSNQLNSFETHLKAAAVHLLSKDSTSQQSTFPTTCLVSVGADWTNREPLLGYPSGLKEEAYIIPENGALQLLINANNNPDVPFFLILDEMNLSHVERYFADFLSAMESQLSIPLHSGKTEYSGVPPEVYLSDNVFIIGTVNIDETTYMFSPKVLDRANVIEFTVSKDDIQRFLSSKSYLQLDNLASKGEKLSSDFLLKSRSKYYEIDKEVEVELLSFFEELKKVGSEFGYRTMSEIIRFISIASRIQNDLTIEKLLDAAIAQKLLPKLHGSRRKLDGAIKALAELCLNDNSLATDFLNSKSNPDFSDTTIKYPLSLEKIIRMNKHLVNNNFTSFVEA
jgi:5-methylcytosine-specific restriction enzyme B